jgi:centromere protein I
MASLQDPLLQKYMMLKASPDSERRFAFWLESYFDDEMELLHEGFGLSPSLTEILTGVVAYTEAVKSLHPVVERFLMVYLPLWDGSSNVGQILDLVSFVLPREFQGMPANLLRTD